MLAGIRELTAASVAGLRARTSNAQLTDAPGRNRFSRVHLAAALALSQLLFAGVAHAMPPGNLSGSIDSCGPERGSHTVACAAARIPQHAYLDPDTTQWECERGYHQTEDGCAVIHVPHHAHLTDYAFGKGWECEAGYLDAGSNCQPERVPPNAYPSYDPFGPGWVCKRGYLAQGESCIAIKIPAHAYLLAEGDRWQCERDFYNKNDLACVTLLLPKNAHLDDTGHDWECDRGFRKQGYGCAAVQVPNHAYATYEIYGRGWRCERGYEESGDSCVAIRVPENAFLRASGEQWQCERGFKQTGEACVPIRVPRNAHLTSLATLGNATPVIGRTKISASRGVCDRAPRFTAPAVLSGATHVNTTDVVLPR